MNIFVVVVAFNGMENNWIEKCLSHLRLSIIPITIIVVDNHSSDNTVSYIKDKFQEVILICSKYNLGFGRANNLGLKKALDYGWRVFFSFKSRCIYPS